MKKIDIQHWKRKAHYEFFRTFDQPFFSMTANVDVSSVLNFAKKNDLPFFYCILHLVLKTVNEIPEFRQRLNDDEVWEYEVIHAGITALMEDKTFLYCSVLYQEDMTNFAIKEQASVETQKRTIGLTPNGRTDVIYVSAIPWVSFTSFKNPLQKNPNDSIPRIVFGKYFLENGIYKMPLAVEVHHALIDGYHVGMFYEQLENNINKIC